METMLLYELAPSKNSKLLAHNFITWLTDIPSINLSRSFLEAGCRWVNGHDMCDALELGKPGLYHYCVFAGLCFFFSAMAYIQRLIPALDRFIIDVRIFYVVLLRRLFWIGCWRLAVMISSFAELFMVRCMIMHIWLAAQDLLILNSCRSLIGNLARKNICLRRRGSGWWGLWNIYFLVFSWRRVFLVCFWFLVEWDFAVSCSVSLALRLGLK